MSLPDKRSEPIIHGGKIQFGKDWRLNEMRFYTEGVIAGLRAKAEEEAAENYMASETVRRYLTADRSRDN